MARLVRVILVLGVLIGLPVATLAQNGLNEVARNVKALDKNFDVADKNHDGLLTKQEAESGPVPFIARHFDAIDTAHRGTVSKTDVHNFIAKGLTRSSQPAAASSAGTSHP